MRRALSIACFLLFLLSLPGLFSGFVKPSNEEFIIKVSRIVGRGLIPGISLIGSICLWKKRPFNRPEGERKSLDPVRTIEESHKMDKATPAPLRPEPDLLPFGTPRNELERALVLKYERKIEVVDFLRILLDSEVFIITKKDQFEIVGSEVRLKADPYLYTQTLRGDHHLGVFTDSGRPSIAPSIPTDFQAVIPMAFRDLFEFLDGTNVGLIINPDFEKNMSWDASQMVQIMKM